MAAPWTYEDTVRRQRPLVLWPLGDAQTGRLRRVGGVQTTALTFAGTRLAVDPPARGVLVHGQSFTGGGHVRGIDLAAITGQLTVTAWVWMNVEQQTHIFGGYQAGGAFAGWSAAVGMAAGGNGMSLWHGGGGWKQSSQVLPADARWHHAAWVITAAGNFVPYVDGVAGGSVAAGFPSSYTGTKAIAARSDGDAALSGGLSMLAIWDRALSAAEVREQWMVGRNPTHPGRHRMVRR